jgi:SAM-dependent methyltransferase
MLDVGCGTGTVASAARQEGFDVVGLDADASMLDLAHRKHPAIVLVCGALPDLPFTRGQFDAVAANFVVSHTADPRASVRELVRVTRPEGRLALTIWTALVGPMNQLWNDVMAAASVERPPATTLPPDKDFERTAPGLAGLLSEAGLTEVAVREVIWVFRISAADLWRAAVGGIATIGQTYQAQQPVVQERMRDAYSQLTSERYPSGELRFPASALLASGSSKAS